MFSERSMRWALVVGLLVAILAAPKPALAWSGCGPSYVVQWGDTLGSVADNCGVSLDGLRQANPNVSDWLYAGQTLSIPDGYQGGGYQDGGYQGGGYQGGGNCYDFQGGSNCSGYQDAANCYGYPGGSNCYGYQGGSNCSTCGNCPTYGGSGNCYGDGGCYGNQYVASSGQTYVVQRGDTMRLVADRLGISVCDLIRVNPQVSNPSLIYAGQVLCLPGYNSQPGYFKDGQNSGYQPGGAKYGHFEHKYAANLYTVQAGEKLKDIAKKFDTTQEALLDLNPSLKGKPGNIYKGLVLVLW